MVYGHPPMRLGVILFEIALPRGPQHVPNFNPPKTHAQVECLIIDLHFFEPSFHHAPSRLQCLYSPYQSFLTLAEPSR